MDQRYLGNTSNRLQINRFVCCHRNILPTYTEGATVPSAREDAGVTLECSERLHATNMVLDDGERQHHASDLMLFRYPYSYKWVVAGHIGRCIASSNEEALQPVFHSSKLRIVRPSFNYHIDRFRKIYQLTKPRPVTPSRTQTP